MSLEQPPEVHQPHAVHGPRRIHWLELVTSLSALLVSVVSISVAVQHGNTMQQLVTANSIPYIDILNANAVRGQDGEFRPAILLELRNVGVGPADVRNVRVLVDGEPVRNYSEWVNRCCTDSDEATEARGTVDVIVNQSQSHFIPAGSQSMILMAPRTEANAEAWARIEQVRIRSRVEVCYCSVFDECWRVNSANDERQETDACPRTEDRFVP